MVRAVVVPITGNILSKNPRLIVSASFLGLNPCFKTWMIFFLIPSDWKYLLNRFINDYFYLDKVSEIALILKEEGARNADWQKCGVIFIREIKSRFKGRFLCHFERSRKMDIKINWTILNPNASYMHQLITNKNKLQYTDSLKR